MSWNCLNKGMFRLIIQTKAWTAMRKYVYVLYDVFLRMIYMPLNMSPLSLKVRENNTIDQSHRMIIFIQIACSTKGCHAECISLTAANKT